MCVLLLPWLIVNAISFCKIPPCGPRSFRRCLLIVMCWYALVCIVAEGIEFFIPNLPEGKVSLTVMRILMYFGVLSFIPFTYAYVAFRRYEVEER